MFYKLGQLFFFFFGDNGQSSHTINILNQHLSHFIKDSKFNA